MKVLAWSLAAVASVAFTALPAHAQQLGIFLFGKPQPLTVPFDGCQFSELFEFKVAP